MPQHFSVRRVRDSQSRVLEARVPPTDPRGKYAGAPEFAKVFVTKVIKSPWPNALDVFVLQLDICFACHQVVDRSFKIRVEISAAKRLLAFGLKSNIFSNSDADNLVHQPALPP